MSVTASTLEIFAGTIGLVIGFQVDFFKGILDKIFGLAMPAMPAAIFLFIIVASYVFGALAVVGGTYCGQRKGWWVAFAGSIGAFFICWSVGLAAIVFTCLSRPQFEK